jgi:NADPH-dependent 2,4-dienoyl-CoA reductase/sulfur reductase-like enzyme
MMLDRWFTELDAENHVLRDGTGNAIRYNKLLLATGGAPRQLRIPGGNLACISYYRTLEGYRQLRAGAKPGKSAVVIGGGFIGSEIAAALRMNDVSVTIIFPEEWLVSRVFPESLGRALTEFYRSKGVVVLAGEIPASIAPRGDGYTVHTRGGAAIDADLVVVGIGISLNLGLAESARLDTGDGILVDEFLRTSHPDVYAAGDVASFPEQVLGRRRIEHWDNAISQGKHAGRNMAGLNQPFTDIPFFFSDLFEFGYEAVGEVDSRLQTVSDWQEPNRTGVIYYLAGGRVRGAMMCNVWEKVDAARELIRKGESVTPESLRGAIG